MVQGSHMIGDKKVFTRVVGRQIMVRTGGGWTEFREWLSLNFNPDSEVDLTHVLRGNKKKTPGRQSAASKSNDLQPLTVSQLLKSQKIVVA